MIKNVFIALVVFIVIAVGYFRISIYPMLPLASAYAAKKMCSCYFISERSQESIQNTDLSFSPLNWTSSLINEADKSATTSVFGMAARTAVFRKNIGCVLLQGEDNHNVQLSLQKNNLPDDELWPLGNAVTDRQLGGVDYSKLNAAIDNAFEPSNMTRAIVVIHRDTLIAEKYLEGFDKDTEILGWSMTKSVTASLFGILNKDGRLSLNAKPEFPEWQNDERKEIRLRHLLNMQSGLAFAEIYDEVSDVTNMLYMAEDVSAIPIGNNSIAPPDSIWFYSSGTSNLLSKYLRNQFPTQEAYLKFPHERLFGKIGMTSAHFETDESGIYIGSSYLYATPRDWAKFGLLHLREGNWFGEQIIDTAWVDFNKSIAPQSGGIYGGHFWHNANNAQFPDVPDDMFSANGFQGQRVWIFPSQDVVVVRMGLAGDNVFDMNAFLKEVLGAFNKGSLDRYNH